MDEQQQKKHDTWCNCGWQVGHGAFRKVLGFIVILIAFWIGVKFGEARQAFREYGFYGHRYAPMMYYGNGMMPMQTQPGGMMLPQGVTPTPSQTPTGK